MNSPKTQLFIYDRKEWIVLIALAMAVAAFAFTLGIHLGKRVQAISAQSHSAPPVGAAPQADAVPNRQELAEASKNVAEESDAALSETLREEVSRTGIHLDVPRQTELPAQPKTAKAGATTIEPPAAQVEHPALPVQPAKSSAAKAHETALPTEVKGAAPAPRSGTVQVATLRGPFTLQVGSYPSMEEARDQTLVLESHGLNPFIRRADVPGMGLRYRIFVGGYESREAAERAGTSLQTERRISTFFISKRPD